MKVVPPWPKPPDTATQKFAAKLWAGISPSSGNNNRWEVLKRNIRLFLLSQVVITSAAAFQRLTTLVTKHPERVLRSFGVLTKRQPDGEGDVHRHASQGGVSSAN